MQFRVAKIDSATGRAVKGADGKVASYYISLSGSLRSKGEADQAIMLLVDRFDKAAPAS